MMQRLLVAGSILGLVAGATSCSDESRPSLRAPPEEEQTSVEQAPSRPRLRAPVREGGALVRSAHDDALFLADEDHGVLRRIPLPVDVNAPRAEIALPGKPAQVLALDGRLLVTIRDPGMLLVLAVEGAQAREIARVALPDDAWGIAVTPDERTALVTSAWSHQVSAVDLGSNELLWSVDVPREPRGIVVGNDGASAYVSHLVGTAVTRLDGLPSAPGGTAPRATSVALPAGPLRAPWSPIDRVGASLGYAAVLDPSGKRLYVARHALGTIGPDAWYGSATVDVLVTNGDQPLAPRRTAPAFQTAPGAFGFGGFDDGSLVDVAGSVPTTDVAPFVQPRAMVYRRSTDTLLVAGEGDDVVAELDATAIAPALQPLSTYGVAQERGPTLQVASACGAPSGLALSSDDTLLWIWCRATNDLAILRLDPYDGKPHQYGPVPFVRLAEDPWEDEAVALGRRYFYDANDDIVSGGLGCAGCHPEGRDDGFVWHEAHKSEHEKQAIFVASPFAFRANGKEIFEGGHARQTPMLAGRVAPTGPYGWHAESPTLEHRIEGGFSLHRWHQAWRHVGPGEPGLRQKAIAAFLREGLVPPPRQERVLTAEEERGKALFLSETTQCAACHAPKTGYTDRTASPLARRPPPPGFDEDPNAAFKVPSLLFVAGTAPYFHDGHAATLEDVVEKNFDRMGKTSHLSREDRAALVAFLRTL